MAEKDTDYEPPPEVIEELEAWDLEAAEAIIPPIWSFIRRYFRAEVTGFDRVPEDEAVLFVGNHSGGFGSPDSAIFLLGYFEHLGEVRPIYWLAHELVIKIPGLGDFLKRCGAVTGSREMAKAALMTGSDVVVYPGGELELHRPWTARNQIQFHGRKGFITLAQEAGVRIAPVVAHGGHNTYLPLTDGERIARTLRLDKILNVKTFPVSLSIPWGLDVGGVLPHVPFPAKVEVEVLPPIDPAPYGDDLDAAYATITGAMQAALDRLAHQER